MKYVAFILLGGVANALGYIVSGGEPFGGMIGMFVAGLFLWPMFFGNQDKN